MAVTITATRTSTLFTDQDGDTVFDPGDVVLTRIRITNAGTTDATGVSVTDTLSGVTLVPGSVQVTPIAFDDFMPSIVGNTPITFTSAQLLGNDVDPDGAQINLTITGVSNAVNGAIVNNGDGTFTFTPTTGFTGSGLGGASFQYTITDSQGLASVTTGIVKFDVTDPVWYVNNATGSDITGDGSWAKPFASLVPLNTGGSADGLDNADDTIFVYNAGTYSSGIVLEAGQKFFGDGHVFMVNGLNIGANGSNTTINHAGIGVTLSTNNTIMGVTLNGTANAAIGVEDGGVDVGTFTMDESSITGLGKAVDIDNGGTLAVDLDQMSSASSTSEGIHLQGTTGSFVAATGIIQTSTGTGVLIGASGGATPSSGGDVNFTFGGDITSPGGSIVEIQDRTGGTVTFSGQITEGAINAGQTGILIDGSAGTVNFNGQTFVSAGAGTGNGVTLTNNTGTVNFAATGTGLDITTTSGTGLTFTGGGTLNITGAANSVVTGTGQILNLSGAMGTSGIAFQTLTSGTVAAGNAININNLDAAGAGTFSGGAVTIAGTGGASTDGINITSSNSTFSFASATIDNTQGDGIEINGQTQTQGAVTFTTVNLDGMAAVGVNIAGATNAVNINGGSIGATNDSANDGVRIAGGTGAVTVAATVAQSSGGFQVVDISGHSGGAITFSGNVTATAGGGGVSLTNNTGGNINFTADVSLTTTTLAGLTFTNTAGTGANVTLSGGAIDITTTSGTGINATNSTVGAGSLTITGASNTVAASTGRAINIDGVTTNTTFLSVGVSGGGTTTGIYLKDTGAAGQFIVTGTGSTAGSGGTIANIGGGDLGSNTALATTGTAVYLNNVSNVSLSNMIFGANAGTMNNYGIRGENVNNFTLRDSEFRGTFGTNEVQDESALRFGTQSVSTGLRGTALFEGNVIGGGYEDNLVVYVYGANTLTMTVQDSASDQAVFNVNSTSFGNDSLGLESGGTSNVTLNVTNAAFNGARGDQLGISQIGNTTQTLNITGNQFLNGHTNTASGAGGVWILGGDLAASSNITVNYTFSGNTIKNAQGDAFRAIFTGTAATINGLILNNTIGTNNGVFETNSNGGSVNGGAGIDVGFGRGPGSGVVNYAVRIEGNVVRDIKDAFGGIIVSAGMGGLAGTGRLEATIKNNSVQEVGGNVLAGLYGIVGGASSPANSQDASQLGLVITGNTFTAGSVNGGSAIFFDQLSGAAHYYFPGYTVNANSSHGEFRPGGGGGTASTSLDTFIDATNNLISGPFPSVAGSDVDANFTTGITNQAFVLAVPIMAAPAPAIGWEDLAVSPVGAPPRDPDVGNGSGTPDNSGGDGTGGGIGESGGGTGGGGDTGGGGGGDPAPTVVNDGALSLAELNFLVEAAIQRWIDAGANAEQVDAMRAVQFGIVDMAGIFVGSSTHGVISVDNDAAGYGWFVDATPGEDSEFDGSGTRLTADVGGAAAGKLDLLTVLMHELGHQIGLGDQYQTIEADDVMFGYVNIGERRLPADGEAAGAVPGSVGATAFALTPVSIGTLPSNKTVDVFFKATINAQTDGLIVNLNNDSTISGSNFSNVVANEQNVLDSLTLGDVVFLDANKNGLFDGGEGVVGVSVSLYADTNDSGGWDAGDVQIGPAQLTLAGGLYSFAGLAPGDYIVVVNASNFGAGQVLEGKLSTAGGTDPDDDINNDDNGLSGVAGLGAGIASQTITLAYNAEPDGTPIVDGDLDGDTNLSLDFGFFTPNAAPVLNNVDGNIAGFIEGGAVALLDVGSNAALSDDQTNFNNGTMTVHIGTGLHAGEDQLGIDPASTVTVNGSNHVLVGATDIGTVSGGGAGGGDLVFTFNSAATPALVQTLIRALAYNNSNTIDPSTDTRSISITLVDGGGTDGGSGADTTVVNVLVNVTGVNDAPAGAATGSDTTNDTTTIVFNAADFNTGFSDPDHNIFAGIVISGLPATGKLKLNNVDITDPATITLAQLTAGELTFVPDAATGGTSVDFEFAVYDDGGILNGGVDTDPTPGTFTITITPSDIAPVLDLDGAGGTADFASSYTEGGAAAAISDTDVTITDADVGDDIRSATITITNAETGDKLNVGALPATVTIDPSSTDTMVKLVAAIGTSAADFEAAIEAVTYSSTSHDPTDHGTNLARTITVVVNDGDLPSNTATATVTVTDDNADAPAGTSSTITAIEDSFRLIELTDLGFSDVDGTFASVTISAVTGGGIYFDADGIGGAGVPVLETLPKTYTAADLAAGKVSFKANTNLNGSGVGTVTFAVTDDDGATDGTPNLLTVDVTAVNDSPVVPDSPAASATEGSISTLMPAIAVSDVDLDARNGGNGDYGGAQFVMNRNGGGNVQDQFILQTSNAVGFTVTGTLLAGGDLQAGGQTFGNWFWDQGTGVLTINFTSSQTPATSALVDAVLQAIQYNIVSDIPPASVDLVYTLNDGSPGGGQGAGASATDSGAITVNITASNDAPFLDLLDPGASTDVSVNYTENDPATVLAPTATVSDPDMLDFDTGKLTVSLSPTGVTAEDRLTIVNEGMGAGQIGVSGANVFYSGTQIGTFTGGTDGSTPLVVTFNANADQTAVAELVRQVAYTNVSDNPTVTDRVIGFDLTDGDGGQSNLATATVHLTATNDAAVAQPDAVSTPENVVGMGNLWANNGSGPDSDAEGDSFQVTALNGGALGTITLASGAKLTVSANGDYSYDPNGKFNTLTNPSGGEVGAVNTSTVGDTFQYTITGGSTVTVTVTVNGVAGPGDWLAGDATNNTISGTPNGDFFFLVQGGDDDLSGLAGNDVFFFGGAMTSGDQVDGGLGTDQIALQGDYSGGMTFGTDVVGVENLAILPGNDTRFGDPGVNFYDYDITLQDENVAPGVQMIVDANRLRVGEDFTFDGSAEMDGSFFIYGGGGTDNLTGGLKNDVFLFGALGQWGASDVVDGGPGGTDQLALSGDYTITFGATQLIGIENLALVSAFDTRFGVLGADYDYNLTMNDGNVANGVQMTVDAAPLRVGETLTFDGSQESNGSFRVFGGADADSIVGSQNADILVGRGGIDTLTGGTGNDVFRYNAVADSLPTGKDVITDFTNGDKIDLSRIDANTLLAGDQAFNFIDDDAFGNHAGELRFEFVSGQTWLIQGDTDGNGSADFEITVMIPDLDPITVGDFIP